MGRFASLQRQPDAAREPRQPDRSTAVPPIVHEVLQTPGKALNASDHDFAGSRLHYDFSKVRVHSGERAAQSASAIEASAYTFGHHMVFGEGRYQPGSSEGRRLLTHELTHVVQQSGNVAESSSPLELDEPPGYAEQAAVQLSQAALAGAPPPFSTAPQPNPRTIQRQKESPNPSVSGAGAGTTSPTTSTAGQQSGWSLDDLQIGFDISNQFSRDASFFMVGLSKKGTGPGLGSWSNRRVFSILPDEHTFLHTHYWADTPQHPIPLDQYQPSVYNDIRFTTAGGQTTVDVHYKDDHPKYQGPGKALQVTLGSTSPGNSDLPVYDLPLNGGGELFWRAGFRFGGGGLGLEVREKFQLQPTAPPVSAPTGPTSTSPTPSAAPPAGKGHPLPGGPPSPSTTKPLDQAAREIKEYTELVKKASDAVRRDPLVKKLREALAAIQPFLPAKDAQKIIDDAVRSLVENGIDSGIMAILQAVTGKSPAAMPPAGSSRQTGPTVPGVPGETIIPGPKLPIPDVPKAPPTTSFHYKNGPHRSYAPGDKIKFTVVPPESFLSITGAKRVVILAEAARKEVNPDPKDRFGQVVLESASPTEVEFTAPQKPGKYVIRVDIGMSFEESSIQDFEVAEPEKK